MNKRTKIMINMWSLFSFTHLMALLLFFLGIATIKPTLAMAGAVIFTGMLYVSLKVQQ